MSVTAKIQPLTIPTYPLGEPEKNPLFFEKRVYQGSCGKVYPVPFIDKVYDEPIDHTYQSVLLENDLIRLVLLPEIGGRIFLGQDKTNNDYDFFYRQDVIKPALVGLAGPWISGGVEFNWPQHHRPGTYLPADVHIEEEEDGARTVWMSEHDPLNRLKGMHGIRIRPGSSLIELRARLYNRTPQTHTFLWWANVAAMVHDNYQSFFPTDVSYVADHAVRATSSFPIANNPYYDIDYQNRPGANDLTWYKNIPVPTSYMVCQTNENFFGGYDYNAKGGFIHVASKHISPGKKQWTWGNDEFGWAWDRELTDENGPYVELMAGVFTDNQPDFSYLVPYETKTFSQYWWPIQDIGTVQQANTKAALACKIADDNTLKLGLCVSEKIENATLTISCCGETIASYEITLSPGESWQIEDHSFDGDDPSRLTITLTDNQGKEILSYSPVDPDTLTQDREKATEPTSPADTKTIDELYFIGEHLEQYRHPTRNPEDYWNEALRRDPGEFRCHLALGKRALSRGLLETAADHFRQAITRLTSLHPNPSTGEAHYFLGLTLRYLGNPDAAYDLFQKATWNYAWRSAAFYQIACIDNRRGDTESALNFLEQSLDTNRQNNKAHILKALILDQIGKIKEAQKVLTDLLLTDPLDHLARYAQAIISGSDEDLSSFLTTSRNDAQTILDVAFDLIDSGFTDHAINLLELHHQNDTTPVSVPNPLERTPMTLYLLADLKGESVDPNTLSPDHFFPSRLEEMLILEKVINEEKDPLAAYALGNFYYDKKRHQDAIAAWEKAVAWGTTIPQVYRNLGIAYWNADSDGEKAAQMYQKAIELDPTDARFISEFDQLSAKRGIPLDERLAFLESHRALVDQRDDATVALADLYNQTDQAQKALDLILSRRFHPWEGGEGAVLRQFTTAHLLLGQKALQQGDAQTALNHFTAAMDTPESLGEAYHPLQAKADVNYWIGKAHQALGNEEQATQHFRLSAEESGDFSGMEAKEHGPLSYYRGLSYRELGDEAAATSLFNELLEFGKNGLKTKAVIDYFATSLPNLLVFEEDLQATADAHHQHLIDLAQQGLQG